MSNKFCENGLCDFHIDTDPDKRVAKIVKEYVGIHIITTFSERILWVDRHGNKHYFCECCSHALQIMHQ